MHTNYFKKSSHSINTSHKQNVTLMS